MTWDFLYPTSENYTNYMLIKLNFEEEVFGSAYYDNVSHFSSNTLPAAYDNSQLDSHAI